MLTGTKNGKRVPLADFTRDRMVALLAALRARPTLDRGAQRPYDEATDHEYGAWETDDLEEHALDMLAVVAHRRAILAAVGQDTH